LVVSNNTQQTKTTEGKKKASSLPPPNLLTERLEPFSYSLSIFLELLSQRLELHHLHLFIVFAFVSISMDTPCTLNLQGVLFDSFTTNHQ